METKELTEMARKCRIDTIKELRASQSGHPGSSLSTMDVVVALYFGGFLRHRAEEPLWADRDLFVLSPGHAAPGYYAVLAHAGYLPVAELATLRQLDSRLEGHVKRGVVPGVENSSGSLGQGLNFGTGLALGARMKDSDARVFVVTSDGEQQEGSHWEGVMFAASNELSNLVAFVDVNKNQINGPTHTIHPVMDDLAPKYAAFGWSVSTIDGNSMDEIVDALNVALAATTPHVIICNTVTGKGVAFMEGDYHWHHGRLTDELFKEAMSALGEKVSDQPDESWLPGQLETID